MNSYWCDERNNLELAFEVAQKLGIPALMEAEDSMYLFIILLTIINS